jgi:hypothetical protein
VSVSESNRIFCQSAASAVAFANSRIVGMQIQGCVYAGFRSALLHCTLPSTSPDEVSNLSCRTAT